MHYGDWNDGMGGGGFWFMAIMMVAFWGALIWVAVRRSGAAVVVVPLLLIAGYILLFTHPQRAFRDKSGTSFDLLYSQQSGIGFLQVLDFPFSRYLLING